MAAIAGVLTARLTGGLRAALTDGGVPAFSLAFRWAITSTTSLGNNPIKPPALAIGRYLRLSRLRYGVGLHGARVEAGSYSRLDGYPLI
jgi:hypothetical protein